MILTGNEIKIQREAGKIRISDFDEARLGPNSYNLRLAPEMLVYEEAVLDTRRDNRTRLMAIPPEGIVLQPGRLYLAKTMEYTETHGFIPMLEGRSSLGRLGVSSHITAGFGDIGFRGNWTLEISVVQPARIYPGMRIGQLYWHKPDGAVLQRYCGKYQDATDPVGSRLWQEMGG